MLTTEARIETERASRYLVQFCRHASEMSQHPHQDDDKRRPQLGNVEWSDSAGTMSLSWGRCMLSAGPDELVLRAEAIDQDNLRRLQDLLTVRLESFGHRDGLRVRWQPACTD